MRVNKTKDAVERTFWTFLNSFLALLTVGALTAVDLSTVHQLEVSAIAAAYTTLKTLAAQHAGSNNDGAAIPGGISE